eukprot:Opistho-2@56179
MEVRGSGCDCRHIRFAILALHWRFPLVVSVVVIATRHSNTAIHSSIIVLHDRILLSVRRCLSSCDDILRHRDDALTLHRISSIGRWHGGVSILHLPTERVNVRCHACCIRRRKRSLTPHLAPQLLAQVIGSLSVRLTIELLLLLQCRHAQCNSRLPHRLLVYHDVRRRLVVVVVSLCFASSLRLDFTTLVVRFVPKFAFLAGLKNRVLHSPKLTQHHLRAVHIRFSAVRNESAHLGKQPLVDCHQPINRTLANLKRGEMRQKVIPDKKAHKHPVVDRTLNVKLKGQARHVQLLLQILSENMEADCDKLLA